MQTIDDEWDTFLQATTDEHCSSAESSDHEEEVPLVRPPTIQPTPIYISTKTKIAHLHQPIDLFHVFWQIPILPYGTPQEGVLKKQMKFNSKSSQELDTLLTHVPTNQVVQQQILLHVNHPITGQFRDSRKISIGISTKDIIHSRIKPKGAFYNCMVLLVRIRVQDAFKEFHVKVFNTGNLEIPGIQDDATFHHLLQLVRNILQPYCPALQFDQMVHETVLINSNFNCGFYIHRDKLFTILKHRYKLPFCLFEPCSYPGIQCKFTLQSKKISFMIFRTGSVLIVGRCDEATLNEAYQYVNQLLQDEYPKIANVMRSGRDPIHGRDKPKKPLRRYVSVVDDDNDGLKH